MGAFSVASLFVFCHVMLHVFGAFYCFFNHLDLTEQRLALVSWVKTVCGIHTISKGLQSLFIFRKEELSVD